MQHEFISINHRRVNNKTDPYQMNNLVDNPDFDSLKWDMDQILAKKLADRKDEFLPANQYMTKWNYLYDRTDSVRDVNYLENNR